MEQPHERESALDAPHEVLSRVRVHLPSLQAAEARVAGVVLEQPDLVIYKSAVEVADLAQTSSATVVRCAQRMGFKGFHDLKLSLARERSALVIGAHKVIAPDVDERIAILAEVTRAGAESVRDAAALVDPAAFDAAAAALAGTDRVLFCGVGTSAPLCADAAYRFSAIGVRADAPGDAHVQHVRARLLTNRDVCVAVSHTGSTRETTEVARGAKGAGATVLAVTSFARSPLTELADLAIVAGTRELGLHLEAIASRLAHLVILDALLVAVAERDPARAQAALTVYSDVLAEHRL